MASPDFREHPYWIRRDGVWSPDWLGDPKLGLNSPPAPSVLRSATCHSGGLLAAFGTVPLLTVDLGERARQGIASWFGVRPSSPNQGPATYLYQVPAESRERYTQEAITHVNRAMTLAMRVVEGRHAGMDKQAKIREAEKIIFAKFARSLQVTVDSVLQNSDFQSLFDFNSPLFRVLRRWISNGLKAYLREIGHNNAEALDIDNMIRGQADPGHVYPIVRRCFPNMLTSHSNGLRSMANNIARMMRRPQNGSKSTKVAHRVL